MIDSLHNCAYIDGSNLHQGMKDLGWNLDYKRFRVWLSDKYDISHAYLFIGHNQKNEWLYKSLSDSGYKLIFKETTRDSSGNIKGNCDSELVLKIVDDYHLWRFWKALIVTSDGDFACVARFLNETKSLLSVISPRNRCSLLLKRLSIPITYIDTQRANLEIKKVV